MDMIPVGDTKNGIKAIAVEDLDFTDSKTREKHGRRRLFRQVISGMPIAKLLSMATEHAISVIAVDPAYTSSGARNTGTNHWPLTIPPSPNHPTPRRERGHRKARPRTQDPATRGTAPSPPER
jgi:IS605 OrfB family transposase